MNGPISEEPAPLAAAGSKPDSDTTRRRWVEANRDRIRESNRRWREENLDRARQVNRESARRVLMRTKRLAEQRARARKRAALWRVGHQDEIRDYQVQWVEQNRDKVRGYYNQYYRTHRDEVSARAAARRDADPERMKQARKAWAERNKQRLADLQRTRRKDPAVYQAQLEANAAARRLRRRLASAGLPPKRLHTSSAAERRANAQEAAVYFSHPDLFEHVRQRTVLSECLTKHMLENGAEMRAFAESYAGTRARMGLPPVAVEDVTYARAVEYVVDHLHDIDLLTSRDVAAAVRSSKATVQRAEKDRQFAGLLKTLIRHVDNHRGRLDEETEIENLARTQRGLPRVNAGALLVRLAVEEMIESIPTNRLRSDDLRSAIRKAQLHIVAGEYGSADETREISSRSYPSQHDPIRTW